ncbi:MAG: N-acetyltransferase family protein [Alphaproteobacteria bacterium]|nr:N-acetyltransferase family protein [Alphaproteobacteria bacterium]
MTSPLTVRDSRDDDLPSITAIYGYHVRHGLASFEEEAPPLEEMAKRRAGYLAAGYPYIVAEAEGHVLGYAYVSAYRPRPAYRFAVENSVYIDQDARRGGIGSALLPVLIGRCVALGYRQMIAVIGDSANAASIGLHAKFGFREIGVIRSIGFKHGRWVDSVLMQRALGDGDGTMPR